MTDELRSMTIRVPEKLYNQIHGLAQEAKRSMNKEIEIAIQEYVFQELKVKKKTREV